MRKKIISLLLGCLCAVGGYGQNNTFPSSGNVGIGTTSPSTHLEIRGRLTINENGHARIYTGASSQELDRYLLLLNSNALNSASGLKAGGILVSDSYSFADPGKNDLIVKGNVGIGTATPQAKLAVNGNILAKEVKVKTDISVPDYVFDPDYELTPLYEVEAYVKTHRHLPDIPSAGDIERDGLDLAEMNLLLLKKVEELTLYILKQQHTINQLIEKTAQL